MKTLLHFFLFLTLSAGGVQLSFAETLAYWKFDETFDNGIISEPASNALVLQPAKSFVYPESVNDVPKTPSTNKHSANFLDNACGLITPDHPSLNFGEGAPFTIELWVKPRQYTSNQNMVDEEKDTCVLIQKRGADDATFFPGYQITLLHSGKIAARFDGGKEKSNKTIISKLSIPLNEWSHIAVSRDTTGRLSLYINGDLDGVGNGVVFSNSIENIGDLTIGFHRMIKSKNFRFDGLIDEVRISNTALEPAQLLCK